MITVSVDVCRPHTNLNIDHRQKKYKNLGLVVGNDLTFFLFFFLTLFKTKV